MDIFCEVCGKKIELGIERHYVARDPVEIRGVFDFSSEMEPTLYDAVDCQFCGSQKILGERKRKYEKPEAIEEIEETVVDWNEELKVEENE